MTCAGDVLELFELAAAPRKQSQLGPDAQSLLERLREAALTGDELVRLSGMGPAQASAALLEFELARSITLEDGVYRAAV